MGEIPKIVLPHGGYKKLIVFRKSEIVYQGTVAFCRRFLSSHGDRTVDQMTQAARSCKQNIAEGSASAAELERNAAALKAKIDRMVFSLRRKFG